MYMQVYTCEKVLSMKKKQGHTVVLFEEAFLLKGLFGLLRTL